VTLDAADHGRIHVFVNVENMERPIDDGGA